MNKIRHLNHLLKISSFYILKKERLPYLPMKLWIEVTGRCNLKCGLCINKDLDADQRKDMDLDLYRKIIDQVSGKIYYANLFHRGEPLLHPDIAYMISYAAKKGIRTGIHTNATLLDGKLGMDIIMAGLDSISFSLDTFDRETYEKKRSGADFYNTLDNIRQFMRIKKQLGVRKPSTVIQLMESPDSGHAGMPGRAEKIIGAFRDCPPDRIVYRRPHNWGGLLDHEDASPGLGTKKHSCTFPWYSLTVFSDGKAYPCPQDFLGAMQAGDINKNSLEEVFNGEPLRGLRNMFGSGKINKKLPCFKCDRILRKTFIGIPLEYARGFFRDNI